MGYFDFYCLLVTVAYDDYLSSLESVPASLSIVPLESREKFFVRFLLRSDMRSFGTLL